MLIICWPAPAWPTANSSLSQQLAQTSYNKDLVETVYQAIKDNPNDLTLRWSIAEYLYKTGNYEASYSLLEEIRSASKENDTPLFVRATLLGARIKTRLRDRSSGNTLVNEGRRIARKFGNPELFQQAQLAKAWVALENGQFENALEPLFDLFASKTTEHPKLNREVMTNLGLAYLYAGLHQQAQVFFETALAQYPDSASSAKMDLLLLKARVLAKLGKSIDEINVLKQVQAFASKNNIIALQARTLTALSYAYISSNNHQEALRTAEKAKTIAVDSGLPETEKTAKFYLTIAKFLTGEKSEAIEVFSESITYFEQIKDIYLVEKGYQWLLKVQQQQANKGEANRYLKLLYELEQQKNILERNNTVLLFEHFRNYEKTILKMALADTTSLPNQVESTSQKHVFSAVAFLIIAILAIFAIQRHWLTIKLNKKLKLSKDQLQDLTLKDALTKLHNRRFFLANIEGEIAYTLRKSEENKGENESKLGILILDIDFFKKINDTHGHHIGDEILASFAARLREVSGASDLVVRWGGEEFVIVTRDVSHQSLAKFCKRLLEEITKEPIQTTAQTLKITCSVGGCLLPLFIDNPKLYGWDKIMDLADQALYQAKENGRNQALIVSSVNGYDYHEDNTLKLTTLIENNCVTVHCIFP